MRIFLVQDGNGTGGGIRLFLEDKQKLSNLHPYVLESFLAIEKNKLAINMLSHYGDYLRRI